MGHPTLCQRQFDVGSPGDGRWSLTVAGDTIVEDADAPDVGADLTAAITDADLSVANLEAPIPSADAGTTPIDKIGPVNETTPETPKYLREIGFDAVTLANNHTMDYGEAGLEHTVEACEAAGLATCGIDRPETTGPTTVSRTIRGQTVTVLNLCEREFGAATERAMGSAWLGRPGIEQHVQDLAAASDVLVVVVHGGIEYVPLPPPQLQARLRSLATAGADLVVGHHPHVPQGWERHDGTPICYSLGNFRYTRCCRPKTEWGLVLSATFDGDELAEFALHPVERVDDSVAFMGERWSPERYRPYFESASEVVADREALAAHWQEQAIRVFEQRYSNWLRMATGSALLSMLRHPTLYLRHTGLWNPDARGHELRLLLNLVRNESHRAVIETTMSVRAGRHEDHRTPVVRDRVRELFETTEDNPVYASHSPARTALRAIGERVSETTERIQRRLPGRQTSKDA